MTSRKRHLLLPALIFAIAALGAVCLYQVMEVRERQFVQSHVADRVAKMALIMHTQLRGELRAVERMGSRWTASDGTPADLWRSDAANYINDLEGLRALEWVDADYTVRWAEPAAENAQAIG